VFALLRLSAASLCVRRRRRGAGRLAADAPRSLAHRIGAVVIVALMVTFDASEIA